MSGAEVPISMCPRMGEEIPDSEEEVAEFMGMGAGGEGAPPGGLELDEDTLNMETKLKDLQEWCRKLGLATSGSKTKCLRRFQKFKLLEEQKLAIDLSKRLYEESQREAIPLQVPKLPSRVDQDLHNLTHIPFASCYQCCVATRAREDARREDERGDKKDRGKSVISFDYGFTYMQGEDEEKRFGTCLCMAESETKAVHAVPVLARGGVSLKQVAEEIVRFSLATSSSNSIILMADGERSTRQILRAVQHCRAQLGLHTEVRTTGVDQHQSNGRAERTVQSVRKLANCLRGFAEAKAGAKIRGGSHVYPWSFRHAAWLMTRFRVIGGRTSYEMMFDRGRKDKVVLFGESVMYKDVAALRGEAVYKRGVWVGKSFWSDSHVLLTPKGAVESRSIRRLTTQFNADDLVMAKGLPWSFSPQGILMKMRAPTTRQAEAIEEAEEATEERAKQAGAAVALGLVTPGVMGGLSTPVPLTIHIPQTPTPAPATPGQERPNPGGVASSSHDGGGAMRAEEHEDRGEGIVSKHEDEEPGASPKRARTFEEELDLELETEDLERKRDRDDPLLDEASPKRMRRVLADFPHGDELYEDNIVMEEAEKFFERGDLENEGDDKPPEFNEDVMKVMDEEAEKEEERRLIKMGVLHEVAEDEMAAEDAYTIRSLGSTEKNKEDGFEGQDCEYKWSVFTDDAFAPTSAYALVRLMIHRAISAEMSMWTVDVKDAFLMVPQPSDENAYGGKVFKLGRVLPGQRTAASQWFKEFKAKAEKHGMECDTMQPSLMRLKEIHIAQANVCTSQSTLMICSWLVMRMKLKSSSRILRRKKDGS